MLLFISKLAMIILILVRLNGNETWQITPPESGMWELGDFEDDNIYENGTIMAPFD